MVDLLKVYFATHPSEKNLNVFKLNLLLKRFQRVHNLRPVARSGSDYLTRGHLLAGREPSHSQYLPPPVAVKSTRAFTKEVEDIEREHSELFQRYFRLQEDYFLELHNKGFTSENNPKLGDVVHVK